MPIAVFILKIWNVQPLPMGNRFFSLEKLLRPVRVWLNYSLLATCPGLNPNTVVWIRQLNLLHWHCVMFPENHQSIKHNLFTKYLHNSLLTRRLQGQHKTKVGTPNCGSLWKRTQTSMGAKQFTIKKKNNLELNDSVFPLIAWVPIPELFYWMHK